MEDVEEVIEGVRRATSSKFVDVFDVDYDVPSTKVHKNYRYIVF